MDRADAIPSLRSAAARVSDARRQSRWSAGIPATRRALAEAAKAAALFSPSAEHEILGVLRGLDGLVGPPPPPGDRWAVVREATFLEATGWSSTNVARALITAGVCSGKGAPADVKRCMVWLRQERRRFRARDTRSASVTRE